MSLVNLDDFLPGGPLNKYRIGIIDMSHCISEYYLGPNCTSTKHHALHHLILKKFGLRWKSDYMWHTLRIRVPLDEKQKYCIEHFLLFEFPNALCCRNRRYQIKKRCENMKNHVVKFCNDILFLMNICIDKINFV